MNESEIYRHKRKVKKRKSGTDKKVKSKKEKKVKEKK